MKAVDIVIPDDFPVGVLGAVGGAQPKVLVVKDENGRYVSCNEAERRERYDNCSDMVQQLILYCQRKREERPDLAMADVVRLTLIGFNDKVKKKGWDFTAPEIAWVEEKVRATLSH